MYLFDHNSKAGLKTRTRRVQAWNFDGEVSTIAESSGKDHQANGGVFHIFFWGGVLKGKKKETTNIYKHDNTYYLGGLSSLGDLSDMSQLAFMEGDVVGQYLASTAPSFA